MMSDDEYAAKLKELHSLLNDPDVPMRPSRVWLLLAEISEASTSSSPAPTADVARD